MLLSREQFREQVFRRDNFKCVFCDKPAKDAHHVLERRLWSDGGYHLNNGASVCEEHHVACEQTLISVEDVRAACKISKPILPPHLYHDQVYDKWGNPVLENGQRLKGELFHDESVQKILRSVNLLNSFTSYVKYPRTWHLPFSPGFGKDDRVLDSLEQFVGKVVVCSLKMDGENTSLYNDYIHARSLDGRNHPSRNWVKQFWSTIKQDIPIGYRVCAENLYARHSIGYDDLTSFLMGFSIWNDLNVCLSWEETLEWFQLLGITPVPVIYYDVFDEDKIRNLRLNYERDEGYVLRVADSFHYKDFRHNVGKYVRKNHVSQDNHHWMHKAIIPNKLKT